ncbi:MAG: cellulase family glycosylhydrolase [Bacteroidaceae bacterium]|nr:cellulase family glycosylhydrolase [Bacteroidaceae bacterium]
MKHLISALACFAILLASCATSAKKSESKESNPFVRVENGQFMRGDSSYYYVGTNFWYGAILGSEGQGGNRERLCKELDHLKSIGINNLRVLVGAQGEDNEPARVQPALQRTPTEYNDTILDGLDFFLAELGKRDMVAVLYLNNSWEWSGGYSIYLQWAGAGKAPVLLTDGWSNFQPYVKEFLRNDSAQALFAKHVDFILNRTNRYTNKKYTEDPAIMAWQVGNEPRAFADECKEPFAKWIAKVAAQIKSIDKNHMVSIGSEGIWGCEMDSTLCANIHADANVDYITCHLWPYNWSWTKPDSLMECVPRSCDNAKAYIGQHTSMGRALKKPVVLEEFGYPRDEMSITPGSPTQARDEFYKFVFNLIVEDSQNGGPFAGCNFWAWGGFAQPKNHTEFPFWRPGEDYTGDPSQEAQGLNSVFAADESTLNIISDAVKKFAK